MRVHSVCGVDRVQKFDCTIVFVGWPSVIVCHGLHIAPVWDDDANNGPWLRSVVQRPPLHTNAVRVSLFVAVSTSSLCGIWWCRQYRPCLNSEVQGPALRTYAGRVLLLIPVCTSSLCGTVIQTISSLPAFTGAAWSPSRSYFGLCCMCVVGYW